jgi:hypothetical protein
MKPQGAGIRWVRRTSFLIGSLCLLGVVGAALERLHQDKATPGPQGSTAAPLLADIRQFRTKSATLDPHEAALEWLRLLDRAVRLGPRKYHDGLASFDPDLRKPVSVQSVIAALPPPSAWPALRDQARLRSSQPGAADHRALVPLLVADVLLGCTCSRPAPLATTRSRPNFPRKRAAGHSNSIPC